MNVNSFNLTVLKGIMFIIASAFISLLLSISVDMNSKELGALVHFIWPPVLGIVAIIVYLLICWIFKSYQPRLIVLIVLCLYLIYVGAALHFEKDYWPLVLW